MIYYTIIQFYYVLKILWFIMDLKTFMGVAEETAQQVRHLPQKCGSAEFESQESTETWVQEHECL